MFESIKEWFSFRKKKEEETLKNLVEAEEPETEEPEPEIVENITPEIEKKETIDYGQYEELASKIDKLSSDLSEHDKAVKMKFDILELNTETITHLIRGLKAFEKLPGIEAQVIERTKQELYMHRSRLYEQEVLSTINEMVLRNEPTFASNITEKLIPKSIGSKQTLYKILKKLVEKDALRKLQYGKFIKYVPSEIMAEKEATPENNTQS
jgi:uncharacterized protein YheU (UPF0270 family)